MKNKKLWELVSTSIDEVNFENKDIENLAKVEMYMTASQNELLKRITKNIVFIAWVLILGLIGTLLILLGLA